MTTVNTFYGSPRYIQYGIVSYGPRHCGTEGKPGIYTRVFKYITWILDNLQPWDDLVMFYSEALKRLVLVYTKNI